MNAVVPILAVVVCCLLLIPVTAQADTHTQDAPSTLVLQCGTTDTLASAPTRAASPPAASVAISPAAAPMTPVPEPSTWLLLGGGLLGILRVARRKHDSK